MEHITACFRVNAGNLQLFPWECPVQRNFKISLSAASPYTEINHIPRHADAGCEVLVLIIRPSHRPERNAVLDAAADLLVAVNSLFHKIKPLRRNLCKVAALMDTKQQRIHHIENNFLFGAVPQRIRPDRRLLRRHTDSCIRRDRRIIAVILLITRRLNTVSRQHRIIHAETAARAVLNDKIRVLFINAVQPCQIRSLMLQKAISKTVRIDFRTNTRFNIVIHLNITNAVIPYHAVNHFRHMFNHQRMTEIELIPASVIHTLSMAQEETLIRQNRSLLTVNTHNLKLQPYPRNHALRPDIVRHLTHPVREPLLTLLPLTDTVPPVAVRIPARINNKVFTSGLLCSIHQRKFFFRRRIPEQTVHIIIKNNRQILIILIRTADPSAVLRQSTNRLLKIIMPNTNSHRNRCKTVARFQILRPVRLNLRRSADS